MKKVMERPVTAGSGEKLKRLDQIADKSPKRREQTFVGNNLEPVSFCLSGLFCRWFSLFFMAKREKKERAGEISRSAAKLT